MSKIVCIDPGHGGTDPGAVNGTHFEKDKALKIANQVKACLEARGLGVVMTRTADITITLDKRTAIERASGAACCLSLHMDAGPASACGMTAFLHSGAPDTYLAWATDTLAELRKVGYIGNRAQDVSRGYRGDPTINYAWNRDTKSPSMLLEVGFITNADNLRDFDAEYKDYAAAIARSVCKFIGADSADAPTSPARYKACKSSRLKHKKPIET